MTKDNFDKVVDANRRLAEIYDRVLNIHDELDTLVTPLTSRSGFRGDSVLLSAADYLKGSLAMLESAFCWFMVKCVKCEKIITKEIESNATQS